MLGLVEDVEVEVVWVVVRDDEEGVEVELEVVDA